MTGLPEGTLTFLLTDIEGSTVRWERRPEEMRLAMVRHDRLTADAIGAHGGTTVELGREGDSILAVFRRTRDAAEAALAVQAALEDEPWPQGLEIRVRVALHTGDAELRGGHYYGRALHLCARLLAIGHGGQTLVSAATQALLADAMPEGSALWNLGVHRLKDVARPQTAFQLVDLSRPRHFPRLRSQASGFTNLPIRLTSFVGREQELTTLIQLLERTRLLTLTGIGGCGKTRLSLELASSALQAYPDGVWLVDLAPISEPSLIASAVASVIGAEEQPGVPIVDTLIAHLMPRRTLLVLDNCEHLVGGCADLAESLLGACPELRMVATSRERLGVLGEMTWRVPPLSLPDTDELDAVADSEAVRLFVERALTHQHDFRLTDENVGHVCQICRRLDGIPLAIELAAARAHVMGVKDILARLEDGFRLLHAPARIATPRQQTLRAAMDWSHDLMAPEEQTLFRRLTVFAGGFTLEAAEQVYATSGPELGMALDLLSRLVEKSLVMAEDGRYLFLETVREYGRERLAQAGEEGLFRSRHARYYLSLAEPRAPGGTVAWLDRVEREHDNMRAALRWSLDADPAMGVRLAHTLGDFWNLRGHTTEARQVLEQMVLRTAEHAELQAVAHLDAGSFAYLQGDPTAASAHLTRSLEIARATADDEAAARALRVLGVLTMAHDDSFVARAYMEESLTLWRRLGNSAEEAELLHQLGVLANLDGDAPTARTLFEESLEIRSRLGRREEAGMTLAFLAAAELREGEVDSARSAVSESLALCRELGDRRAAWPIDVLACVTAAVGEHETALELEGASAAIHRSAGTSTPRSWQALLANWLDAARAAVDQDTSLAARRRGEEMSFEEALQFALGVAVGRPDTVPRQRGSIG